MSTPFAVPQSDPRIAELLAWAAETGQPLPLAIDEILYYESVGYVVDLSTGDIYSEDFMLYHLETLAEEAAFSAAELVEAVAAWLEG